MQLHNYLQAFSGCLQAAARYPNYQQEDMYWKMLSMHVSTLSTSLKNLCETVSSRFKFLLESGNLRREKGVIYTKACAQP